MAFCCASWFLKITNAHDVVDLRSAGGITHALERWQRERGGDFDVDKGCQVSYGIEIQLVNLLHHVIRAGSIGIHMMVYNSKHRTATKRTKM